MSNYPENTDLRKAVELVVYAQYSYGAERVMFLDPSGELRDVLYLSEGSSAIHAKRAELLSRGLLGAVLHLSIADYHGRGRVSMVEVIGDPELYTLTSWPAQGNWGPARPDAQARWQEVWEEGAKEET